MTLLFLLGCTGTWDTWDTAIRLHEVEPEWFSDEFTCSGAWGEVALPLGAPVLIQVFGTNDERTWWSYERVPEYEPGDTMAIPCEDGQRGGRVTYVHEPVEDSR